MLYLNAMFGFDESHFTLSKLVLAFELLVLLHRFVVSKLFIVMLKLERVPFILVRFCVLYSSLSMASA